MSDLGEFPVDESALTLLSDALNGYYTVDPDGTHHLHGSEFTVHQLLEFYSGYDEAKLIRESEEGRTEFDVGSELYTYPEPMFSEHDVLRALIAEIRRLRQEKTDEQSSE